MERLDLTVAPVRANIEAAIHFARYGVGKGLAKGKHVLDIACGEGYGSYLLKQEGAASVVGVDISVETVAQAQASFGSDGLRYVAAKAEEVGLLFPEASFDLVISVETIEHLEDPVEFLRQLKRLAKKDGVIVLSCPNDHWYYPEPERSNPYHRRKYRMEEFQALCVSVLGGDVNWSVGTGVFGFGSTPLNMANSYKKVPGSWMSYREVGNAYLVNGEPEIAASATQCSYFVGVWNAPDYEAGLAVFPLSMDDYASMATGKERLQQAADERAALERALEAERSQLAQAQQDHQRLVEEARSAQAAGERAVEAERSQLAQAQQDHQQLVEEARSAQAERESVHQALLQLHAETGAAIAPDADAQVLIASVAEALKLARREQRRLGLRFSASQAEREAIRQALVGAHAERDASNASVQQLQAALAQAQRESHEYRVGYERYIRLRRVMPQPLRAWMVGVAKSIRGR